MLQMTSGWLIQGGREVIEKQTARPFPVNGNGNGQAVSGVIILKRCALFFDQEFCDFQHLGLSAQLGTADAILAVNHDFRCTGDAVTACACISLFNLAGYTERVEGLQYFRLVSTVS